MQIEAGSFDADDADSLADLGDLVVAAYRDAKSQADAARPGEAAARWPAGSAAAGGARPGAPGLPGGFGV